MSLSSYRCGYKIYLRNNLLLPKRKSRSSHISPIQDLTLSDHIGQSGSIFNNLFMKKLYKQFLKYLCRKAWIIIDITVACDEFTIQVEDWELMEFNAKESNLCFWNRILRWAERIYISENLKWWLPASMLKQ